MKKYILKITLGIAATLFGLDSNAQCPTINCPGNITVSNTTSASFSIMFLGTCFSFFFGNTILFKEL